jgi:hypothetical protein
VQGLVPELFFEAFAFGLALRDPQGHCIESIGYLSELVPCMDVDAMFEVVITEPPRCILEFLQRGTTRADRILRDRTRAPKSALNSVIVRPMSS